MAHRGNSGDDELGETIVRKLITGILALPPRRMLAPNDPVGVLFLLMLVLPARAEPSTSS